MKKLLFIMNPYAGTRKANRYLPEIIEIFNQSGYEVTVYMTAASGDGTRIARERSGDADLVVCCGGDGTFNETVAGLLAAGQEKTVGYIPAGSTNDFAASLHLPTDILKAARLCVEGEPKYFDGGSFGGRYFSYVASFGAFTRASYATPQSVKNALGHVAYVLEGMQELSQIKNIHARLELDDGRVLEDDYLFGAVSNSTSVGGILSLDPRQVDMSDGKLEILLIRAPREFGEVPECIRAVRRQEYNCGMITFAAASSLRIFTDESVDWTLDGEWEKGRADVEVNCLHNAVYLMKERENC